MQIQDRLIPGDQMADLDLILFRPVSSPWSSLCDLCSTNVQNLRGVRDFLTPDGLGSYTMPQNIPALIVHWCSHSDAAYA